MQLLYQSKTREPVCFALISIGSLLGCALIYFIPILDCVVFDPLDGSSNIDCGVAVGTIFGIYHLVLSISRLTCRFFANIHSSGRVHC